MATHTFRFLDLPKEIRLMVYERLPRETTKKAAFRRNLLLTKTLPVSILRVSRTIYEEAKDILKKLICDFVLDPVARIVHMGLIGLRISAAEMPWDMLGLIFAMRSYFLKFYGIESYNVKDQRQFLKDNMWNGPWDQVKRDWRGIVEGSAIAGYCSSRELGHFEGALRFTYQTFLASILYGYVDDVGEDEGQETYARPGLDSTGAVRKGARLTLQTVVLDHSFTDKDTRLTIYLGEGIEYVKESTCYVLGFMGVAKPTLEKRILKKDRRPMKLCKDRFNLRPSMSKEEWKEWL